MRRSQEFQQYGGTLVAATMGVMTSCVTLTSYSIGVFIIPLGAEFGWSRQQILGASAEVTWGAIGMSLLVGWLADRMPARSFIAVSQAAFGLGFALLALLVHDLTSFYMIYALLAIVSAGTLPITFTRVVAATFIRRRGLALGIALSGTGLAGLIVPPYVGWITHHFGWRAGFLAVGSLPLIIATPLTLGFLSRALRAPPAAATRAASGDAASAGVTLAQALLGWRFWVIALALFLASGAAGGLSTNLVPLLVDRGFAAPAAANLAAVFGLAVIVGRLVVGSLVDRLWAPLLALCFLVPAAIATWLMTSIHSGGGTVVLIALVGLATGTEGDLLAYLVTCYFGLKAYGRIFAGIFVPYLAAIALVAPAFGRSFDVHHSYHDALRAAAVAWLACAALLLSLGPYPRFLAQSNNEPGRGIAG